MSVVPKPEGCGVFFFFSRVGCRGRAISGDLERRGGEEEEGREGRGEWPGEETKNMGVVSVFDSKQSVKQPVLLGFFFFLRRGKKKRKRGRRTLGDFFIRVFVCVRVRGCVCLAYVFCMSAC